MKSSLYIIFLITFIFFMVLFLIIAKNNNEVAIGIGLAMIFGVVSENNYMLRKLKGKL